MRLKRYILAILLSLGWPALAFGQDATATVVVTPTPDGLFAQMFSAVASSNWRHVGALALLALVWALRTHVFDRMGRVGAFLQTDRGGVLTALVCGVLAALGSAVLAGKQIDADLVGMSLQVSLESIGGLIALRRLWRPKDKALEWQGLGTP